MIEIYGKSTCNWCDRAREVCEQYSLTYKYRSVDDRFDGEQHMISLREKAARDDIKISTVPAIWWNENFIGGFNELVTEIENTRNFGQEKV